MASSSEYWDWQWPAEDACHFPKLLENPDLISQAPKIIPCGIKSLKNFSRLFLLYLKLFEWEHVFLTYPLGWNGSLHQFLKTTQGSDFSCLLDIISPVSGCRSWRRQRVLKMSLCPPLKEWRNTNCRHSLKMYLLTSQRTVTTLKWSLMVNTLAINLMGVRSPTKYISTCA